MFWDLLRWLSDWDSSYQTEGQISIPKEEKTFR